MFRWPRSRWLTIWGARPFTVRTPMSVTAAVAALDADRATRWTALGLSSRGAGFRHVTGSVTADGVRLTSRRAGWSNPFTTSALAGRRDEEHLRSWVTHRLRGAA